MIDWKNFLKDDCGGAEVEYLMVLGFVVIPIAMLEPLTLKMLNFYATVIFQTVSLPFG